ncbi:MAG: PKD domain-containing protein, partial [Bacteroidetes bacterium]|nr:PKD domain-containing protein [Bacteroidota bacterium]
LGSNATSVGTLNVFGEANFGLQSVATGAYSTIVGTNSPNTKINFYGNVNFGQASNIDNLSYVGSFNFLGSSQKVAHFNLANAPTNTTNYSNFVVGDGITPTYLTVEGTTSGAINNNTVVGSSIKVKNGSTLDLKNKTLNTIPTSTSTFVLSPGAVFRVSGSTGGINGSNFPNNFSAYILDPTSTVEFYGAGVQTIPGINYGILLSTANGARTLVNSGVIGVSNMFTSGTNTYTTTGSTVSFNGAGAQNLTGNLGNATNIINNLTINNTGTALTDGLTLSANIQVGGVLAMTAGYLNLNGQEVRINTGAVGSITRTNGIIRSESTDFTGKVTWNIGTTAGAHVFPFGKNLTSYNPYTYTYSTGDAGLLSVATYGTDALNAPLPTGVSSLPQQGAADNANKVVDRFWKITSSIATATTGTMVFGFPVGEKPNNATQLQAQRYNGATWDAPITGQTNTATSVTAPAVTNYGIFGVFDQAPLQVVADFTPISKTICTGETINFLDQSTGTITSWNWTFDGGTPMTSTIQNPSIVYNSAGVYTVSLTVSDGLTNDTKTLTGIITVNQTPTVSVNNATICPGEPALLTATASVTGGTFLWSPGGKTTSSITVSPTVTTIYTVTYTLNGCSNTGAGTVTVTTPATATISGGGTVCEGQTATVSIDFTGTGPWDVTYTDGTTPVTVTGIATTPYIFNSNVNATYTLSDVTTTCPGTVSGSATVTILEAVQVVNLITTCDGTNTTYVVTFEITGGDMASYTVTGGSGTLSGAVFTSDPIASGTTYTFTVTDVNNCIPKTVTNTVVCNCAAEATMSGGGTVCEGDETTINIDLIGTAPWSITYTDGTTPVTVNNIAASPYTFMTGIAGDYIISSVSDANCVGSTFGGATVTTTALPTTPIIIRNGFDLTSDASTGNQWYRDAVLISGAINQLFTATQNGTYTVVVTENSCSSSPSNEIIIGNVGVEEIALGNLLKVYPNPTQGRATIEIDEMDNVELISINILNMMGQKVGIAEISNKVNIDLSEFEPGIYHLSIEFNK